MDVPRRQHNFIRAVTFQTYAEETEEEEEERGGK